ncbi:helix-turn-helix domain-containing protein [Streptomyces sp. E-08]|uniref:helix-turn-helix domain-containing protein n=1 Tax=Streptomyces sp. E-08 TaxID=3404047 RepID=UPI003CF7FD35
MSEHLRELKTRLQRAQREAGDVSTREIARRTHGAVSHTTAHQVLRGDSVPSWRSLEAVVSALNGDVAEFKRIWVKARESEEGYQKIAMSEPEAARIKYRETIDPEYAAVFNLARVYRERKDHATSIRILTTALDSSPYLNMTLLGELGAEYWYSSDGQLIRDKYGEAVNKVALNGDIEEIGASRSAIWFARRCEDLGDFNRALRWAEAARCLNPHSLFTMRVHAEFMLKVGRYSDSADLFLEAHCLDPKDVAWLHDAINALKLANRWSELESMAKRTHEATWDAPEGQGVDALGTYIKVLRLCGKLQEARRMHELLNASFGEDLPYYRLISYATILEDLGEYQTAKSLLFNSADFESEKELRAAYANLVLRTEGAEAAFKLLHALVDVEE